MKVTLILSFAIGDGFSPLRGHKINPYHVTVPKHIQQKVNAEESAEIESIYSEQLDEQLRKMTGPENIFKFQQEWTKTFLWSKYLDFLKELGVAHFSTS